MNQEIVGDVLVIELPGRLDAKGLAQHDEAFSGAVRAHGGNVLVDMRDVTFVASLALRMLLMNLKAAQQAGGDLRLCALQPAIADIFRKSRFDMLFTIYPDRQTALADFGAAGGRA